MNHRTTPDPDILADCERDLPPFVGADDLAEYLGVHKRTVRNWISKY